MWRVPFTSLSRRPEESSGVTCGFSVHLVRTKRPCAGQSSIVRGAVAVIQGTVWVGATAVLVALNIRTPWLATTVGVSMLVAATVTTAMSYWMCERALRPTVASLLTKNPPATARRPGLRMRAVGAWVVGTGVPDSLADVGCGQHPGNRLPRGPLGVGCSWHSAPAHFVSGLTVAAFTAATPADPIDEIRRGMQRVERANYDVSVPVLLDACELGLLQAGFNAMVGGLRERERLRDLFGRHVSRDVARLAEQSVREDGRRAEMGGENCEVAVLFVTNSADSHAAGRPAAAGRTCCGSQRFLCGRGRSYRAAPRPDPNKFAGDAALAIFGAPGGDDRPAGRSACGRGDSATSAQTARATRSQLGIGVSAGVDGGRLYRRSESV